MIAIAFATVAQFPSRHLKLNMGTFAVGQFRFRNPDHTALNSLEAPAEHYGWLVATYIYDDH